MNDHEQGRDARTASNSVEEHDSPPDPITKLREHWISLGRPTSFVWTFLPDLVDALLDNNECNRAVVRANVAKHKQAQLGKGLHKWYGKNPHGVIIGPSDELLDGQNRLYAAQEHRQPVEMVVSFVDDAGMMAILNTGKSRTTADSVRIGSGITDPNAVSLTNANYWLRKDTGTVGNMGEETVRRWYAKHRKACDLVTELKAIKVAGVRQFNIGVYGAIAFAFPLDEAKVAKYARSFVLGTGLRSDDPILVGRNWVLATKSTDRHLIGAVVLTAIYYKLNGRRFATKVVPLKEALNYFRAYHEKTLPLDNVR